MKKILSIGLMLCIFMAMIVGTAAAKSTTTTFAKVDGTQKIDGFGTCVQINQNQVAAAVSIDTVKAGCVKLCDVKAIGIDQNQCASVKCGAVCAQQCASLCVATATCK